MKLSDIKEDRVFDVLADLIRPVANIAQDKAARRLFTKEAPPAGVSPRDFAVQKVVRCLPVLIRVHKHDLATILAVIKGVSVEEYLRTLNLAQLTVDVLELLNDEAFMSFFTSAAPTATASGAPSESTEDPEN